MAPPNVKIKHITRSPSNSGDTRFPKLDECAHFHYENVELGPIKVLLCDKQTDSSKLPVCNSSANKENEADRICFLVTVISNGRKWMVRRSYKNFMFLDTQLHRCVYDRKYSLLRELPNISQEDSESEDFEVNIRNLLSEYLERFSQLAGSLINCGPVLNWFELDNRGNRLIVTDEVAINTPAVAAAYVVVPYSAQATDEISFDVGDMISVIDMPPPEESSWWRGKKGFEVGFFPSECVEVIGDKVPHTFKLSNTSTKPVFRRHGKLIAFFRSFLLSRPSRRRLKQSGILKERVFGCDLGEHLLNTGREIPMVLKCCTEFIEEHGIVDGIYRLSGVSSNIQRLRLAFDEDRPINLGDPATVHDIHSVASLLKMYFRELPNPLLTYQLYDKFVSAVQSSEDVRLLRVRDVVQQLPPPHFRTLQYLLNHLARVASHGDETGMTPKNIAIVWAPNLLRSRDVENGGVGALHVVGVQAVLTEYLIRFSDLIFDEKVPLLSGSEQGEGFMLRARPKSLAISTPTKLLSLEEARARALSTHLPLTQQKYIEVGGGPDKLPSKYHTVIELPGKQGLPKLKKSPSGWKSFFSRGWYSGSARDKGRPAFRTSRKASTGSLPHPSGYMQDKPISEPDAPFNHRKKLRTVKSAESLAHCVKESPQSTNKDGMSGVNSHKSSPQVSVDSSNSLEVSSPSSKSPGLQKHTRSSSHESYFESNSMDIISEPSFEEDEHGLFYYVSEQMRMLQDSSSLPWHSDQTTSKRDSVSMKCSEIQDSDGYEMYDIPIEVEKNVRKQKLTAADDFAQAKVQRLNEANPESVDSSLATNYPMINPSVEDTCCHLDCSHRNQNLDNSQTIENFVWKPQVDDNCEEYSPGELALDPILIYDAILNKRCSSMSSDNENDLNNRTVVERYGNAETVLVEVHATQDSSSEEEQYLTNFENANERKRNVPELPDESMRNSQNAIEFCNNSVVEEKLESEFGLSDISLESHTLLTDENVPGCNLEYMPEMSDELIVDDTEESLNPSVENIDFDDLNNSSVNTNIEALDEMQGDQKALHSTSLIVPNESATTPEDCDVLKDVRLRKKPSNLILENSLLENIDLCLKFGGKDASLSGKSEELDNCNSFSIIPPPSPVYPPKSLKSQEFQSLKTKIEHIPLHKKKQILKIPSPSSPVEEVRKKFELHATSSRKTPDLPTSEVKSRSHVRELASKHKKAFEVPEQTYIPEEPEKRKSESVQPAKCESSLLNKRHSEPPPKTNENVSSDAVKRISSKYEGDSVQTSKNMYNSEKQNKAKSLQPSLFTQLKIRKLQSLQPEAGAPHPEPIDPWSDPILDLQEDYHPLITYSPSNLSISTDEIDSVAEKKDSLQESEPCQDSLEIQNSENMGNLNKSVRNEPKIVKSEEDSPKIEQTSIVSEIQQENCGGAVSNEYDTQHVSSKLVDVDPESEAVKRERINRIKEERRAQLREKLKQESFRMEAEEKEKVQTKFRLRKECFRHSSSSETQEDNFKDVKKSDKAVETDSTDITETGTNCDLNATVEDLPSSRKSQSCNKLEKDSLIDKASDSEPVLSSKLQKPLSKTLSSDDYVLQQNKSNSGKKSSRSYEDSRKWLSMPPTDIRDKVAMFERSKDTKELCRLGPNGKFPQKQSPSALTSSFVR